MKMWMLGVIKLREIRQVLVEANVVCEREASGHIFRRSGALILRGAGVDLLDICDAGRWRNTRTLEERYLRGSGQKLERAIPCDAIVTI